ncbi:hypothetical protein EON66_12240, partial [archaeon]
MTWHLTDDMAQPIPVFFVSWSNGTLSNALFSHCRTASIINSAGLSRIVVQNVVLQNSTLTGSLIDSDVGAGNVVVNKNSSCVLRNITVFGTTFLPPTDLPSGVKQYWSMRGLIVAVWTELDPTSWLRDSAGVVHVTVEGVQVTDSPVFTHTQQLLAAPDAHVPANTANATAWVAVQGVVAYVNVHNVSVQTAGVPPSLQPHFVLDVKALDLHNLTAASSVSLSHVATDCALAAGVGLPPSAADAAAADPPSTCRVATRVVRVRAQEPSTHSALTHVSLSHVAWLNTEAGDSAAPHAL